MNIKVNGKPLDFTLENENKLFEVIKSLEKWLGESQLYIGDIVLDGKNVSLSDDSPWLQENILEDTQLEIEALSARDLKARHFSTIKSYFQIIQQSVNDRNTVLLKQLSGDWEFVLNSLSAALAAPSGEMIANHLKSFAETTSLFKGEDLSDTVNASIILEMEQVIQILESRVKELHDPKGEALKASRLLQGLIPQLEEVSVFLQTGRDQEAMRLIVKVIELIQTIIRATFLLKSADNEKRDSIDTFIRDLNDILRELEEAFQSDDSVLIGDLVEYELITRLQGIPEFLGSLNME